LQSNRLPSVSVLVPTLNSARTLGECLAAIREQDYPAELVEIVVADAGSSDETVEIAERFGARVVENRLITGEAGKAAAFRASSGQLVALIDSDNIVVGRDWLRRMVAPFQDPAVVGTEPMYFVAEPSDTVIDRYCAIFGVNDPLCLFIGNYDKFSALSGRWTGYDLRVADAGDYILLKLDTQQLPTIGANGTMYRREVLDEFVSDYLMDIDVPVLIAKNYNGKIFGKVRVGIRHLFCSNVSAFVRKQRRRIRDFFAPSERGYAERAYPWRNVMGPGILRFVGSCVTIVPLLYQSLVAYSRSRDKAAFFHPVACVLTLGVYGSNFLFARGRSLSRSAWKQ
jgi:glycosyltransferase involved in cell wall biosynthesis